MKMARGKKRGADDRITDSLVLFFSTLVLVVVAYPLLYVISASLSDPTLVASGEILLLPKRLTLEGYRMIFRYEPIWLGYRNTMFYTFVGTLLNLAVTVPAAYALCRRDMPGRGLVTLVFSLTMFFSGGLIPTYLVYKRLRLINTIWALLIPGIISMWNTVICRTYFQSSIPVEIQESGHLDGCSDFRLFLSIILPLSKPILAVLALFYAVGHWNSYFNAMIYLSNPKLMPLQIVLRNVLIQDQMLEMMGLDEEMLLQIIKRLQLRESMKFGIIVVSSLPVLAFYPFIQKYFIKGLMVGALKG